MKRVGFILVCASLAGCVSTDPQHGATLDYRLPRTDAKLALDLTLRSCEAGVGGSHGFIADAEASIIPIAGAQSDVYRLDGAKLASAHIKRSVEVTLNGKGVITAINSENEDQSPEILANVLKTAATIAAAAGLVRQDFSTLPDEQQLTCREDVRLAVARSQWLQRKIVDLRRQLVSPKGQDDPTLVKQLTRIAKEKAGLDSGILHIQVSAPLRLDQNVLVGDLNTVDWAGDASLYAKLDPTPFEQWFGPGKPAPAPDQLSARDQLINRHFGIKWAAEAVAEPAPTADPIPYAKSPTRSCGFAIAIPQTQGVAVAVHGAGDALPDGLEAGDTFTAAQHLPADKLCMDVGFGESRSVALTFDDFGRKTKFGWSSNATAVSASSAIAGIASTASEIKSSLEGPTVIEKQEEEIKKLETQKKLNELRACQAVIDAGGFDCDQTLE